LYCSDVGLTSTVESQKSDHSFLKV